VHGWYYDILTGRIEQYDEGLRRFVAWGSEVYWRKGAN